jgi:hypothetical protein
LQGVSEKIAPSSDDQDAACGDAGGLEIISRRRTAWERRESRQGDCRQGRGVFETDQRNAIRRPAHLRLRAPGYIWTWTRWSRQDENRTDDVVLWVKAEVASGRFRTAEDAVRYAVNQVKLMALRAALEAPEAEGGEYSSDEVREYVFEHLDRIKQTPER